MGKGWSSALLASFVVVLLCELKATDPSWRDYNGSPWGYRVGRKISPLLSRNDLLQHEHQHLFPIISNRATPDRRINNPAHGGAAGIASMRPRDREPHDKGAGNSVRSRLWRGTETRRQGRAAFLSSSAVGGTGRIASGLKRQHVDPNPKTLSPASASLHRRRRYWQASSLSLLGGVTRSGQPGFCRQNQRGRNSLVVWGAGDGGSGENVRPQVQPWRYKAVIIPG